MGHELKLCLASASPRRQELLRQIGVEFDVMVSQIDEQNLPGEKPADYVLRVARDKAVEVRRLRQASHLSPLAVLGADTCVTLDGIILGKPRDREDGEGMLRRLSGRTHEVVSAIALLCGEAEDSAININLIRFISYALIGFTVGVTAIMLSSRMNSISSSNAGIYYELDAIAAVVIGGTSMSGGSGTIYGTVVGAIILGIINNMLNMLGISPYLQGTVKGLVIIFVVLLQYKKKG